MNDTHHNDENLKVIHPTSDSAGTDDLLDAIDQLDVSPEALKQIHALLNEQKKRETESNQRLKTILNSVVEGTATVFVKYYAPWCVIDLFCRNLFFALRSA